MVAGVALDAVELLCCVLVWHQRARFGMTVRRSDKGCIAFASAHVHELRIFSVDTSAESSTATSALKGSVGQMTGDEEHVDKAVSTRFLCSGFASEQASVMLLS